LFNTHFSFFCNKSLLVEKITKLCIIIIKYSVLMGNCCKSNSNYSLPYYPDSVTLNQKHPKTGKKVNMTLLPPYKQFKSQSQIEDLGVKISSCIFQSQDLQVSSSKLCQDSAFILKKSNFIFATLFDGHGPVGQEVVQYCESLMSNYLESEPFIESAGSEYLEDLFMYCDDELISVKNKIDVHNSGTTAVSIIVSPRYLYVASVGDSRAVLGTVPGSSFFSNKACKNGIRVLEALQLTIDQKPNLEEEMSRIIKNGGIVNRALDRDGNPGGPYRVFCKENLLGLAMSRSLGDVAFKQFGVIGQPIHECYPIYALRDQFIIIASDGLWDVFTNDEAVQFVETFRYKCQGTIADLLSEEARYRWTELLSKGETQIDDIAVMIIEFHYLGDQGREETYIGSRSSVKNLGSIVEIQSDTMTVSTNNIRSTMIL
jgi:serine/threonine protein phosphatase PrpC